jgi:pyruvate kinase
MAKTKIIATLGPASEEKSTILRMVQAGMDVARLNFSHGNYENFEKLIKNTRLAAKTTGKPVAILQDLQGPKIRIGKLLKPIELKKNQEITLSTAFQVQRNNLIPVQYRNLHKDVKKDDILLINDGLLEIKVISKKGQEIKCKVITPGLLTDHKGINVPSSTIKAKSITSKDIEDLKFGLKHGVEYVALSFVSSSKDIKELKNLIKREGKTAKVIAKIERKEAIDNLEAIIKEADGVMVARGDLGLEIKEELVPLVQKKIIKLANIHGKPVIVATQMLQSMIENPRATRAEISDVATAVFEYADAVMLSNETAVGSYPIKAVQTLEKVARSVEGEQKKEGKILLNVDRKKEIGMSNATCLNACELAEDINANLIIAITEFGRTAREISKHRPFIPIITFTDNEKTRNEMALIWGINKIYMEKIPKENYIEIVKKFLSKEKLVKLGDEIVICKMSKKVKIIDAIRI